MDGRPNFDQDDTLLLLEMEKLFLQYYTCLGEARAFELFQEFRKTAKKMSIKNRRVFMNRQFVVLRNKLAKTGYKHISSILLCTFVLTRGSKKANNGFM
jgi:hypothetical protein